MISAAIAPARLPFAPRPIPTELLSSWLLRVAAANCVELSELLQGLAYRYGRVLSNSPMDHSFPDGAVRALSEFCRIAPEKIRVLDLRQRAPHLDPALLLRVQNPLAVLTQLL
jgi:TniQ